MHIANRSLMALRAISSVILSPKRWSNTKFFTNEFARKPSSLPGGVFNRLQVGRRFQTFMFEISACFLATVPPVQYINSFV
jgi:hypothetical protein